MASEIRQSQYLYFTRKKREREHNVATMTRYYISKKLIYSILVKIAFQFKELSHFSIVQPISTSSM